MLNDLAQCHLLDAGLLELVQDTGAESKRFVEIFFGPAVVLERKLRRLLVLKIGIEDAERVELGHVVAANLVCTDEELDL
jgi:hypothetical protein